MMMTGGPKRAKVANAARARLTDFNAFDNDPWIVRILDFVRAILAQDRVRFIGVCWGHQIVGRALGARVAKSGTGAWEVSVCRMVLTEQGKELFGGKDALVSRSVDCALFSLYRSHSMMMMTTTTTTTMMMMMKAPTTPNPTAR